MEKNNRNRLYFSLIVAVAIGALAYLFPYSGDDWAWGSEIGIGRLKTFFEDYNGRYAGNLLVLMLTRSKILNVVIMTVSCLLICWIPSIFAGSSRDIALIVALALFLFMPSKTWVEAIAWTSGFCNYVPPIILYWLYFVIIRNIFEEEVPWYSPMISCVCAIIGFVAALFMENVTLYGLAASICVLLYAGIKFKRFFAAHVCNFAGSVLGAMLMFSNSAYTSIAQNSDSYRTIAINTGILHTISENLSTICQQFCVDNTILLLILTLLNIALVYIRLLQKKKDGIAGIIKIALYVNIFCYGIILGRERYAYWLFDICLNNAERLSNLILLLLVFFWYVSSVIIQMTCVEKKSNMHMTLWATLSVPMLIAPLAVVTPIGPRCFFPPYFSAMVACICILDYITIEIAPKDTFNLMCKIAVISFVLCQFCFYFSIYGTIHMYDVKRQAYVAQQIQEEETAIKVCKLPYGGYVHVGNPTEGIWQERYKLFYDIDSDVTFELVSYKEFENWVESYG